MKKMVALIATMMVLVLATLTPVTVRAETLNVTDVIENIMVTTKSPTPEDWDKLVERFENHEIDRSGEVRSIDQICELVLCFEKDRMYAIEDHHNIMYDDGFLGLGFWETDPHNMEDVKKALQIISKVYEAKTGVKILFTEIRENPEDGYHYIKFYTKESPYWQTHQITKLGETAYAQCNVDYGYYYESAWNAGSGKKGHVCNAFVSWNEKVSVIAVAYLDDQNEVVEVVSGEGIHIHQDRKRMLLIRTDETLLGWIAPENVVTD